MTTAALSSERRTISVVQYNVLAEGLSNPAMSPDAGFTSMPPEQMRWAHRGELVLDRLIRANADIVCLQEVDHYYDSVEPAMRAAGYAGLYREDEWSSCSKNTKGALKDGVALFYRRSKLELVASHLPFAPRSGKVSSEKETEAREDAGKCIVARFRVRRADVASLTGREYAEYASATESFIACTAHFAAAKTEEGETRRAAQASALWRELRRFRAFSGGGDSFSEAEETRKSESSRAIPIILAGDLNARPEERAVRYLKSRGLVSAYEKTSRSGSEPAFTTWKIRSGAFKPGEAKMCIDYVFASPRVSVLDVSELPSEREIGEKALPCAAHPSDHLMLRAELTLPVGLTSAANEEDRLSRRGGC